MFAVQEYKEVNWRSISFLKLVKDLMALTLDGRLFHKCVPLQHKTTFLKIGTGLRQSQFVITIPQSLVRAEGLKQDFQVLRRPIIQSFKHQFQFLFLPSDKEIIDPFQLTPEGGSTRIVIRLHLVIAFMAQFCSFVICRLTRF